jgi:hypothetical protein
VIDRHVIPEKDLKSMRDELIRRETYFIGGASSVYVPSRGAKWMSANSVMTWPDIDGTPTPMTPGEAARTELGRAFPGLKRVGWQPGMISLFDWRSPMHYAGPQTGDFLMIDLKSAYYQVYRRLWLNVPYPRGFGSLSLMPVAEALREWKAARNSLVGVCASREAIGIRGQERKVLKIRNKYLSPGLWASVQAILHTIAAMALFHGAVYINTDGYIFPSSSGWEDFVMFLDALFVAWEFRAIGDGVIAGWNSYQVGDKSTHIFRSKLGANENEFSNIKKHEVGQWVRYIIQVNKLSASTT